MSEFCLLFKVRTAMARVGYSVSNTPRPLSPRDLNRSKSPNADLLSPLPSSVHIFNSNKGPPLGTKTAEVGHHFHLYQPEYSHSSPSTSLLASTTIASEDLSSPDTVTTLHTVELVMKNAIESNLTKLRIHFYFISL
jgi:hypothetical protein